GGPALWPAQNQAASGAATLMNDESSAPDQSQQVKEAQPTKQPPAAVRPAGESDKSTGKPVSKVTTIRGRVLDDETGEPIPRLVIQGGHFDPADPDKVRS